MDNKVEPASASLLEFMNQRAASLRRSVSQQNEKKALELYRRLQVPLKTFTDQLNHDLIKKAHKKIAEKIEHQLSVMLYELAKNVSAETKKNFEKNVNALILKHKKEFKETPFIWYDVLKPAIMTFIGSVLWVLTFGFYGKSFFQRPDSADQILLQTEATQLLQSVDNVLTSPRN